MSQSCRWMGPFPLVNMCNIQHPTSNNLSNHLPSKWAKCTIIKSKNQIIKQGLRRQIQQQAVWWFMPWRHPHSYQGHSNHQSPNTKTPRGHRIPHKPRNPKWRAKSQRAEGAQRYLTASSSLYFYRPTLLCKCPQQEQVIGFWSQNDHIICEKRQDLDTSCGHPSRVCCSVQFMNSGKGSRGRGKKTDSLLPCKLTSQCSFFHTAPFVAVFLIFSGSCFLPAAFPLITTSLSLCGVRSAFSRTVLAQKVVTLFVWKCSPARITK